MSDTTTPAGTDFRIWQRPNLERLAAELTAEVLAMREQVERLTADRERLDWLQEKYGAHPWKLVDIIPGTNDVRVAIDRAIDAARGAGT